MEFGEALRSFREQRGWSIRVLAERAELDPGYVSRVERGTYSAPRAPTLERLIQALELDPDEAGLLRRASGRADSKSRALEERVAALEREMRAVKQALARLDHPDDHPIRE